MALALLHDIPVWTLAPLEYRRELYRRVDRFGVAESRFVGYWDLTRSWRTSPILISAYVHEKDDRSLLVVANRDVVEHVVTNAHIETLVNSTKLGPGGSHPMIPGGGDASRTVPARDFLLLESQ
jgi:hypothetical protein